MNAARQRRLTPVLAGAVVLLGVLLLVLLGGAGRGTRWAPPRTLPLLPPAGSAELPQAKPLQQFSLVWEKPLFNPDRKPVAHASEGGSNLGDLELTGIIITPDLRMALLHDKNANREIRLRQGASLPDGSVTLVEVQSRSAVFDSAAGRTELKLPAGAPIDQARGHADEDGDQPPPPASAGGMRAPPDAAARPHFETGPGLPRPSLTPAASDNPSQSALERLRRTIEKRRAERAAASHEGEH